MAAQVKKYDPNQYNFEDFAKTMNQNFAIERSQNGQGGAFGVNAGVNPANPVNLGGTTNSQTLGNLGANGVGAVGVNAGGVGNLSGVNTVGQAKPLVGRDMFRGITNSFFDVLKANGKGESVEYSSPLVPKKTESSPTVQKVEADIPEKADQVRNIYAIMNASGGNKSLGDWIGELSGSYNEDDIRSAYSQHLSAVSQAPIFNGGGEAQLSQGGSTLSFEDWQSAYSIDPTVEYQNAQAQLDYEFKTWMSDYGARAEQLYQMGLSNSGVSDIYGANAYTAYVQASMDLKRAEIAQQAENKRAYQKYFDGIETQQSAVTSAAFNSYAGSYTPDQAAAISTALVAAMGLTTEQAESVIAQLNSYYNSLPEDQRPDVVASNAKVNEAFQSLAGSYATDSSTDKDQRIRDMYAAMGWSQSEIDKLINMLNGFAGVSGSAVNPAIQEAYLSYVGSYEKNMANTITADLQNLGWSDEDISTLIGMLDKAVDAQTESLIDKEIKDLQGGAEVDPLAKSFDQIVSGVSRKRIEMSTGDISSSQFNRYLSAASNLLYVAMKSLESPEDLNLAYSLIGMDEQAWNSYDSWEGVENDDQLAAAQLNALLEKYSSLHAQGIVSDENYRVIIEDWFRDEINTAIEDDTDDAMASGLGKIGAAITTLKQYAKLGKMDDSLYNALINIAASEFDVTLKNKKVKLTWGNSGSDATLKLAQFTNWNNNIVKGEAAKKIAEIDNNAEGPFVTYNNKLYMRSDKATEWLTAILGIGFGNTGLPQTYEWIKHLAPDSYIEIKPEEIMVLGEGGKTMDYSKEGIYEMLKIWSSPEK